MSTFQKLFGIFLLGFFGLQFQQLTASGILTLNTDLRITGSTTMLGAFALNQNKITIDSVGNTVIGGTLNVLGATTLTGFPSSVVNDLRVTGSTSMLGKLTMNQNKMVVDASGNTTVGGTLESTGNFSVNTNKFNVTASSGNTTVAGTLGVTSDLAVNTNKFNVTASSGDITLAGTLGLTAGGSNWVHKFGQKSISSIGTSATSVLSITFASLAGASGPLARGARIRLYALASGSVTLVVLPADSVIFYAGDLIVSPGATGGASCTLTAISQTSTTVTGNASTITASVTGTGTSATLNLAAGTAIASQASASIFYEIVSDNVSSVS